MRAHDENGGNEGGDDRPERVELCGICCGKMWIWEKRTYYLSEVLDGPGLLLLHGVGSKSHKPFASLYLVCENSDVQSVRRRTQHHVKKKIFQMHVCECLWCFMKRC